MEERDLAIDKHKVNWAKVVMSCVVVIRATCPAGYPR